MIEEPEFETATSETPIIGVDEASGGFLSPTSISIGWDDSPNSELSWAFWIIGS